MKYSEKSIEDIKSAARVYDVISPVVSLKKEGSSNWVGKCPFHDEKSGSFKVWVKNNVYKCFGCGKSGDAIQFLIDYKNLSYPEALEELAKMYNISLETDKPKVYQKPNPRSAAAESKVLEYFKERQISEQTIKHFGITETKEWMPQFQKEVPVICFNYYRAGEFQYQNLEALKRALSSQRMPS